MTGLLLPMLMSSIDALCLFSAYCILVWEEQTIAEWCTASAHFLLRKVVTWGLDSPQVVSAAVVDASKQK